MQLVRHKHMYKEDIVKTLPAMPLRFTSTHAHTIYNDRRCGFISEGRSTLPPEGYWWITVAQPIMITRKKKKNGKRCNTVSHTNVLPFLPEYHWRPHTTAEGSKHRVHSQVTTYAWLPFLSLSLSHAHTHTTAAPSNLFSVFLFSFFAG